LEKGSKAGFRRSVTRWDTLLLGVLILLSILSYLTFHILKPRGGEVWVSVNNRTVGIYPLNRDRTIQVKGPIGTTVIRIHQGEAAITKAPCTHKLCQKMGPIPAHGPVMICIPNRIVVEIKNRKGRETDAITR